MPRKAQTGPPVVYQIKVTLKGVRPAVWRRIQVAGDSSLDHLHGVLQEVMGWMNSHLHQFIIEGRFYGEPHPDYGLEMTNEKRVKLGSVVGREKTRFVYEYDFGDGWEHELLVEKILPPRAGARYPVCLAGARNCPPEDCGGVWGYANFLEAIRDPRHAEH